MLYFKKASDRASEVDFQRYFFMELKKIFEDMVSCPDAEIIIMNEHHGGQSKEDAKKLLQNIESRKSDKMPQLFLVSWSYHSEDYSSGREMQRALSNLYLCNDGAYIPTASETELVYIEPSEELPLIAFDKVNGILYLLWDAFHYRDRDSERSGSALKIIRDAVKFFKSSLPEHVLFTPVDKEFQCTKSANLFSVIKAPKIASLKKNYEDTTNRLNSLRKEIAERIAQINEINRSLSQTENMTEDILSFNNKYIRHVVSEDNTLVIFTEPIFVTEINTKVFKALISNHDGYEKYESFYDDIVKELGKKYGWYIGQFKIEINFNNWNIRFFNLDNRRPSYWAKDSGRSSNPNYYDQHPHVSRDGDACMGTLSDMISSLQSNYEIEALTDILIQYLQSANLDDAAGKNLYEWELIDMIEEKKVLSGDDYKISLVNIHQVSIDVDAD